MEKGIVILKKYVDKIPILFVTKEGNEKKEIIFLLHKLLNNKESELPLAYKLAIEGYFVIILDIAGHGERNSLEKHKYNFQNMLLDANQTVNDIEKVIQYIKEYMLKDICIEHIGIIGTSFGGSIALMAGYRIKIINYIVCLVGTCNLRYVIENKKLQSFRPFFAIKGNINYEKIIDDVERFDCLKHYNSQNLKPMLFLDGKLDMTVPYKEKMLFYKDLESIFIKANREWGLKYKFYPNAGHQINTDMVQTLIVWLEYIRTK